MPKQSGLNVRQKKFVVGVASGLQLKTAAEEAGYRHPGVTGCKLMKTPAVKKALSEILEENGLDDAFIAGKVRQFCEAEKEGEGGIAPDYPVQLRGVEILCKLKGLFKTDVRVEQKMTFEQKVEMVKEIKANPELLDVLKQRLIEIRRDRERGEIRLVTG